MILGGEWKAIYGFLFSVVAEEGNGNVASLTEIEGRVVGRLPCGLRPEIEWIAGASALEAMKDLLFEVDGEAAGGSVGGAVQRAGATML